MNSVCLIGRLTRTPVMRFEGESQICTCTLTISERGRDERTFTLWIPLVAWGKAADALGLLEADTLVAVQGKLCWRKVPDKSGQDRSALHINVREVMELAPSDALTGQP